MCTAGQRVSLTITGPGLSFTLSFSPFVPLLSLSSFSFPPDTSPFLPRHFLLHLSSFLLFSLTFSPSLLSPSLLIFFHLFSLVLYSFPLVPSFLCFIFTSSALDPNRLCRILRTFQTELFFLDFDECSIINIIVRLKEWYSGTDI